MKRKIVLEQSKQNGLDSPQYIVKRLVNRTEPRIGEVLTQYQVDRLISPNTTVEVMEAKAE